VSANSQNNVSANNRNNVSANSRNSVSANSAINDIQLNASHNNKRLNIGAENFKKIATMRKATVKNIAEIGDLDLLSDDENFSESPKLNKQNTMKLRQDLTVIFGDE